MTAFFRGKRYGHNTSNIVESLNKTLSHICELPVLDLLNEIWHSQIKLRFKRLEQARNPGYRFLFTPLCNTEVEASRIWAQSYTVEQASRTDARVIQRGRVDGDREENLKTHIVNRKFYYQCYYIHQFANIIVFSIVKNLHLYTISRKQHPLFTCICLHSCTSRRSTTELFPLGTVSRNLDQYLP